MKRFFLINFAAGAVLFLLLWPIFLAHPTLPLENGPLENLQAALLGGALLLLLGSGRWWWEQEDSWIGLSMVAVTLTMLLRELDLERLPLPSILVLLGSGVGRNLLLILLWLAVVVAVAKRRERLPESIRQGLSTIWGWGLLLGAGGYLLAELFDRKIVPLAKPTRAFCEETLETLAVFWLVQGVLKWVADQRLRNRDVQGAPQL